MRNGGFFRSTDKGATWAKPSAQPFNGNWIWSLSVDNAIASRIWVAGQNLGLIRSNDGGVSWGTPVSFFNGGRVSFVDASNGTVVVLGRTSSDTYTKIYYSGDNGTTWKEQSGTGHRYAFAVEVALNPWRTGQIWVSGVSVNVNRPQGSVIAKSGSNTLPGKIESANVFRLSINGKQMPVQKTNLQLQFTHKFNLTGQVLKKDNIQKNERRASGIFIVH